MYILDREGNQLITAEPTTFCKQKLKERQHLQEWIAKSPEVHGDKEGISSVRINDQYRIEFTESMEEGKPTATICNITDLSNHYK